MSLRLKHKERAQSPDTVWDFAFNEVMATVRERADFDLAMLGRYGALNNKPWLGDVHTLLKFAEQVEAQNARKAFLLYKKMDTAVRDLIPNSVLEIITRYQ